VNIDIKNLVTSVPALQRLRARIGWPDDPTFVNIANPKQLVACLDEAISAFHELRPTAQTLVDVAVNDVRELVLLRIVQNGYCDHHGQVEAIVEPSFKMLRTVVEENNGVFHYWGGNNYIDVGFPHGGSGRQSFPEVDHLPWDQRYRNLLDRASWWSLRNTAFRFSNLAVGIAGRCIEAKMNNVLIPSVGLCIAPWLFASCGLSVTATDISEVALAALSEPIRWPLIYSHAAYERWDVSTCAAFASVPHPDHFTGMPALEDEQFVSVLRKRIGFVHSDWARVPLETATVDLVFATNAVPRESIEQRVRVLEEWIRVLRPGGVIFIVQHHPPANWKVEDFFLDRGLGPTSFLGGERPGETLKAGFQIRYSSG
jgi:hypothetical protein